MIQDFRVRMLDELEALNVKIKALEERLKNEGAKYLAHKGRKTTTE